MNWIDISDKNKLYAYAKNNRPTEYSILALHNKRDSYFYDCNLSDNIYDVPIMKYYIEYFDSFLQQLNDMWISRFSESELLSKIVAASAFKNMPCNLISEKTCDDNSELTDKINKNTLCENVDIYDIPSKYIYEF